MNGRKGTGASITNERIEQLNSIGFEWRLTESKPNSKPWHEKYQLLRAFQVKNGHSRVPFRYEVDSVKLGTWVKQQRHSYKDFMNGVKGTHASITSERIEQLNLIGFEWRLKESIRG